MESNIPFEERTTLKYTEEDLQVLEGILSTDTWGFCNWSAKGFIKEGNYQSNTSWNNLIHSPLEYVPLFINAPEKAIRILAKWRLKIGK